MMQCAVVLLVARFARALWAPASAVLVAEAVFAEIQLHHL